MRKAGILLPVFSLPGRYGIGCLGKEAIRFIDMLYETGNRIWQVLPMGPTGFGDSPYQSFSAFAGNPYLIDLEKLTEQGLLTQIELDKLDFGTEPSQVDYGKMYCAKFSALRMAYEAYLENAVLEEIFEKLRPETIEYCEFMAIKDTQNGASWNIWPDDLRDRKEETMAEFRLSHQKEIGFYAFIQMIFEEQWSALHAYARQMGIEILGDIPIYCAPDSADAWAHRELFKFDTKGYPTEVAGVPPDVFSATGQLWGNPLYNWKKHKRTGYEWWLSRLEYCLSMFDSLRVDHFRGFEAYYAVPFGDETAENGKWYPGPGMDLFKAIFKYFGTEKLSIIAEDLGIITDEVRKLIAETGFPGMKILQFAWDSGTENAYLPMNFKDANCVCYTGTHDNDTLKHWFETLPDWTRDYIYQYTSRSANDWKFMPELLIKEAMASIADTVIIPAGDYLNVGEEARINLPGRAGGNWQWRMKPQDFDTDKKMVIAGILKAFGRFHQNQKAVKTEDVQLQETSAE